MSDQGNRKTERHNPAALSTEIRGAFGTLRDEEMVTQKSLKRKLLTLLAVLGPGIIVMVGDNDAGGISTYAQAGQNYGTSLLWTLVLIIPVLIINQEMVVRLGAVTGVGLYRLIAERLGKMWARVSIGGLFLLDFLTIATEFAGVTLSLGYFNISKYVSVPVAAALLVAISSSGSFRRWERFMFIFVFANFLVIPLVILSHPHAGPIIHGYVTPKIAGGVNSTSILFVIGIVGTTVAPWQLFFQQSNIVDKKITPRWINYERADTVIGSAVTVFAATLIISATAFAFSGHAQLAGHFVNGLSVAIGLDKTVGSGAGALFAIILLNASMVGAASVTLTSAYAYGDMAGVRSSLNRSFAEAKQFYFSFAILIGLAAAIVLIPHAPLGLFVLAVQAFAGILLPLAMVFGLLLCNDREVLGPWVNAPWLNIVAGLVITILLGMSAVLMITTVFPTVPTSILFDILVVSGIGGVASGITLALGSKKQEKLHPQLRTRSVRERWQMPPSVLLRPANLSRGRKSVLFMLFAYLLVAVSLLLAKSIELGLGHH
ncbi:MAG TPA: NRAMP family divalent metal transporter [Acidimicrobiales bacterium]|nr:NRAMP family divalent metal transporter [Acidimicrobiales bacterium]